MRHSQEFRVLALFGLVILALCCGKVVSHRANNITITGAAGGSYKGELPRLGKVQLDLFSSGGDIRGWLYREGTGLSDWMLVASNLNDTIVAVVWQPRSDVTNLMLEFYSADSGNTLEGQAWNPADGDSATFKLTRACEHKVLHGTGRQLGRFDTRKDFYGEFPFFPGNSRFERALAETIIEENSMEAKRCTRTGILERFQNIRDGWGRSAGWMYVDSFQWQPRLKTECIASFAVWWLRDHGGNGNPTRWKGANYWWHDGRIRSFEFEELFEDGERGELQMRRYCSQEFTRQGFLSGAQSVLDGETQFDAFTVSSTGMQVYFNPYNLSSGAYGEFIVHIPYSVLRPYFKRNGPAGALP